MLSVSDSITNDILKEDLQDPPSLLIDESTDTLDTPTTSKTPNCRLGDALNVVPQNLPVTLCSSLAQTLASLTTARHLLREFGKFKKEKKREFSGDEEFAQILMKEVGIGCWVL